MAQFRPKRTGDPALDEALRQAFDYIYALDARVVLAASQVIQQIQQIIPAKGGVGVVVPSPCFTDRGDPVAADYEEASLVQDANWHNMDLVGIVPAGAVAVLLRVTMQRDDAWGYILLRKKGNVSAFNAAGFSHGEAGVLNFGEMIVGCDANQVIEYSIGGTDWTLLNLTVGGWWK